MRCNRLETERKSSSSEPSRGRSVAGLASRMVELCVEGPLCDEYCVVELVRVCFPPPWRCRGPHRESHVEEVRWVLARWGRDWINNAIELSSTKFPVESPQGSPHSRGAVLARRWPCGGEKIPRKRSAKKYGSAAEQLRAWEIQLACNDVLLDGFEQHAARYTAAQDVDGKVGSS